MKANTKHNFKRVLIIALSIVCCLSLFTAIGCSGKGAQKSVFYQDGTTFVLESDYTLSIVDEKARRGGKNEVRFTQAITLDLQGYILDLGGRTLTVENDGKGVVTFKNGTITDGKLNISVPNGDVDFDNVTIAENVSYELEAASETIRMNNSNLNGQCTIKSNTHVEINRSSVSDLTLSGNGYVNVNEGATLGKLEVGKNAEGAKVKVGETSKITGELNLSAAADVVVSGEVASLNVTEEAATGEESKLNVTVKSTANVLKLALKAAADVQVQGTVSSVEVESEDASVNVTESATVFTVKMSAAGEVSVAGDVGSIIVSEEAEGAKVDLTEGATVQDIVVGANGTEINVSENATIESVKVVENVTDATLPEGIVADTVTKDHVEELLKHTHLYQIEKKVAPTCTTDGIEVYKCVDCDEVLEKYFEALGHDYKYETIKEPTEISAGQGKYTCTRCGHSYTVVLKPENAITVTVSGLSETLRKIFGEGFQVDLGSMVYVQKEVEKNYKDGKLESTYVSYYLIYIKQCDLGFDFSSDEKVKGSFNLMAYMRETDDISKIDLSDLSTVEFDDEAIIHAYLDGEKVYVYVSEEIADGDEGNIAVNLDKFLEYLCESDEVPEAINLLANALRFLIDLDGEEVDLTSAALVLGALQNALSSFNPADGMNVFAKFMLDNFFAKTVGEDGLTTYAFDFEKVKEAITYYGDMTLSEFVDELFGEKASKNLFETLRLIPDLTLNNAVTYLKNQLAAYAIDLEAVYPYVESFIYENLGVTVSVEELLDTFGDSNVAAFVALIGDIELDEAEEIVKGTIETVIGYIDDTTVDEAVTYIYNYVKDNAAGGDDDVDYPYYPDEDEYYDVDDEEDEDEEVTEELSAVQIVCGLIDYVKDCVTLKYVMGENFNEVYVDVAGYKFTLSIDEKDGFTLSTALAIAEQVMAEVSVKLNENKFGLSADVLNYGVEATADKEKGTFTVSVYQNQSEDEEAEELAALTFACVNNKLTLKLSVAGDEFIDFTAGTESGNVDLMIPTGDYEYVAVNVNWETEDNVTTVYITYDETVLRVTFNLSKKASLALSLGAFDEDDDFVATLENVFTADVSVTADQNGTLTGMTVEYALDGSKIYLWGGSWSSTGWKDEIIASHETSFYLWKHKVEISFNQKITVEETNKDLVKGDIEKLQKLEFEYEDYDETYRLYYVEEENDGVVDKYYLLTVTEEGELWDDYMTYSIYVSEMIIDCDENGLPVIAAIQYRQDCTDWYWLGLAFNGEVTFTEYEYDSFNEELSTVSEQVYYKEFYVEFCYNVKTGETSDYEQHTWTVTDVKYHADSHECQDGLTVTTKCSVCGKIEVRTSNSSEGCIWITKEVKTITTTCGDMYVVTNFCPGCGDIYVNDGVYANHNHDMEHSGTASLTEEDLKEKYPTAYCTWSSSDICMLCNLVIEKYTVYTHDATNGCHRHNLYRFLQIDHNTEEATLLYETEEDYHDKHCAPEDYDFCKPIVIDEDYEYPDEVLAEIKANNAKGQRWLDEINQKIGRNYSLNAISIIEYREVKCDGCGRLEEQYYRWKGYLDAEKTLEISGSLRIYYDSDDIREEILYGFDEPTSNVYDVISVVVADKMDALTEYFGFDLTALSEQSAGVHYSYACEGGGSGFIHSDHYYYYYHSYRYNYQATVCLENGDEIHICDNDTFYKDSISDWFIYHNYVDFDWYDHSECSKTTLEFDENGNMTVEEVVRHDYSTQITDLGDNCKEDGWYETSVCDVCGHKEDGKDDIHYYHHGYREWSYPSPEICDNLYVYYEKYRYTCCGVKGYGDLEVYLTDDVVLDKDVYIYYDYDINLRLNGYTLDLNGYDFVICSNGGTDVNIYDTGYVYNEETGEVDYVLGEIVNSKTEDEKGLLVICINGGNIDVANINISCNFVLSDDDDATTIVESVYNDTGYVLTLGTRYPQI